MEQRADLSRSTPRRADHAPSGAGRRPGLGARLLATSDEARAGWIVNGQYERFFLVQLTAVWEQGKQPDLNLLLRVLSSEVQLRFESLIKGTVAQATDLRHYPHSVCDILFVCSRQQKRGRSYRAVSRLSRVTTTVSFGRILFMVKH